MGGVSNGQVGRYDIRRGAVVETALVDEVISTVKLQDVAVTIEKTAEPVFVTAFESEPFFNPTLTTTFVEQTSIDVDIPTWVAQVSVFATARLQMGNSSGSTVRGRISCRVNDNDDGSSQTSIDNGESGHVVHIEASNLIAPGSTVQVSAYAAVDTGTNANNNGAVWGVVIGTR